jgi:hypothetical protein
MKLLKKIYRYKYIIPYHFRAEIFDIYKFLTNQFTRECYKKRLWRKTLRSLEKYRKAHIGDNCCHFGLTDIFDEIEKIIITDKHWKNYKLLTKIK